MRIVLTLTAAALLVSTVRAEVTIGSFTFDDNAFADAIGDVQGDWTLDDGAASIFDGIVGPNTDGRIWSYVPRTFVEVLFLDNVVFNGVGDDLAVFETGVLDLIAVEINGVSIVRDAVFSGDVTPTNGYDVNVASFDLSEFGIGAGESITSLRILGGYEQAGTVSAYSVIGAMQLACPWDLDGSGMVGPEDLIVLLGAWGEIDHPADLVDPVGVGPEDLIELLGAWGPCPK